MVTLFASVSQGDNYETIVCDDYMLSVKYTVSDNYGLLRWLFGFDWQNVCASMESLVFLNFWQHILYVRRYYISEET